MMRYLVQKIFVKGYGLLSFAKNMDINIGKKVSKSLSFKYSQKRLNHAKKFVKTHLTLLQKEQFKKQLK